MVSAQNDTCARCGSDVVETRGVGRVYTFASGMVVPVPDDWALLKCHACGSQQLATRAQLNELLRMARRPT